MSNKVDLYNGAYGNYEAELYRQIRIETYGDDLGQTSWVTTKESNQIPQMLNLTSNSSVFELGCGSGRYALQVAEQCGCRVLGVDINESGVRTARRLAEVAQMSPQCRFEQCDASKALPCADGDFDAAFSNDVLCHIPSREHILQELLRVLRPGGRLIFSDALVINGVVSSRELAIRSSIGNYVFLRTGLNEQLIEQVGFRLMQADDTTASAAMIAKRWHDARESRREALIAFESETKFDGLQEFLHCVHTLTRERRLLRMLYTAQKP
ncbi:MAG TPA: methyltransferase domain-containing protein [Candidatus Binatia bacterium]|nr:methyltransferase domain-containing protein [Candidatus Binatia bacterium]